MGCKRLHWWGIPPAPPLMEALTPKPPSMVELEGTAGTASEVNKPTVSAVVKALASIALASIKHQVKTDFVSFAGACLLVVGLLVVFCRTCRFLCRPRYSGAERVGRSRRSRLFGIDLRKVKPRRRRRDEENEGEDDGDEYDEYDEYTDDEDDDGVYRETD